MPIARSWPWRAHASARPRTRVRIAMLIRIARSGPSSHRTGSLKKTMSPSPANLSRVPSKRKIRSPSAWWYSLRTPITSSGSLDSANMVNPRRSQKATTTSRRWLSRNDSSPESTISSASCGERKRRSRPMRCSCSTCVSTRDSSSWFQAASSLAWRLMVSWYRLIRASEATRANSSFWLIGLLRKSSAPASRAWTFCSSPLAVTMTTGRYAVSVCSRILRHTW